MFKVFSGSIFGSLMERWNMLKNELIVLTFSRCDTVFSEK